MKESKTGNMHEFVCTDCRGTIHNEDKVCPHCGSDTSEIIDGPEDSPKKFVLYVFAVVACGVEGLAYAIIGVLLGWRHAGGIIPMVILFAVWAATWTAITKSGGSTPEDRDDTNPPPNAPAK